MKYNLIHTFDHMPVAAYFVDKNRKITYWNQAAETVSGYPAAEVIGSHCYDNILMHIDETGRNLCRGMCPLASTIQDGTPRKAEVFLHHKDGHRVPVHVHTSPLMDNQENIIGGIEIFTDMTEFSLLRTQVKTLENIAKFDDLTGLPNRSHMTAEIDVRLHEKSRYGTSFATLFIDIDHFKNFNDTYGHRIGDQVLKTTGATLSASSRPFDVFARWGGEEFVGLLKNIDPGNLIDIADRYRRLIKNSQISSQNEKIGITVSIGATMATVTDTIESIVDRADRLMYESKKKGRDCCTTDL